MAEILHIANGRCLDPASGQDATGDIFVRNGVIVSADSIGADDSIQYLEAAGCLVTPGLIDVHVHFREPGYEQAETIASGSAAAARGGFTTVVTMPNTSPPTDSPAAIARVRQQAETCGKVRIIPSGCLTRNRAGKQAADLAAMAEAGAGAFTDDGATVQDDDVMAEAMRRAADLNLPVMDHALHPALAASGVMRAGSAADRLGLPGIPAEAETRMVERDIRLAQQTGCSLHIQHISSRDTLRLIAEARGAGLAITAEITPHHLALCDEDVDPLNPNFKMSPPLGTAADRDAMREALSDGTISTLATDHAPHTAEHKALGFLEAPFGLIGLETAVGVTYTTLVKQGGMPVMHWLRAWTTGPADILNIPPPSLAPNSPGDLILLDPDALWTVDPSAFFSASRNSPFAGQRLTGQVICTVLAGKLTWQATSHIDKSI